MMNVEALVKVNNDEIDESVMCMLCVFVMIKILKNFIGTRAGFPKSLDDGNKNLDKEGTY